MKKNFRIFKKQRGQSIVEYAGALVVAVTLVATVVAAGPSAIGGMFNAIVTNIQSYFTGAIPS